MLIKDVPDRQQKSRIFWFIQSQTRTALIIIRNIWHIIRVFYHVDFVDLVLTELSGDVDGLLDFVVFAWPECSLDEVRSLVEFVLTELSGEVDGLLDFGLSSVVLNCSIS